MYFTNDPVGDAERHYEEQEARYKRVNAMAVCECCGKPCGAEPHYRLWGDIVACSKECARKLLDNDDIDELISEWFDSQQVDAGTEDEREW